ncbi:MAG: hypothetical protein M3367_01155, partial [Acidobacteriota bacterium]|nr:hypothetical protein [Acidobacteriota bacterium]
MLPWSPPSSRGTRQSRRRAPVESCQASQGHSSALAVGTNYGLILQLAAGSGSYLLALILLRGIPPDVRLFFHTPTFI